MAPAGAFLGLRFGPLAELLDFLAGFVGLALATGAGVGAGLATGASAALAPGFIVGAGAFASTLVPGFCFGAGAFPAANAPVTKTGNAKAVATMVKHHGRADLKFIFNILRPSVFATTGPYRKLPLTKAQSVPARIARNVG